MYCRYIIQKSQSSSPIRGSDIRGGVGEADRPTKKAQGRDRQGRGGVMWGLRGVEGGLRGLMSSVAVG